MDSDHDQEREMVARVTLLGRMLYLAVVLGVVWALAHHGAPLWVILVVCVVLGWNTPTSVHATNLEQRKKIRELRGDYDGLARDFDRYRAAHPERDQ